MALRLIELVLPEKDAGEIIELLKEHQLHEHRQLRLPDGVVLVRILLDAEKSETVLDLLENKCAGRAGYRLVMLPVEATLPRIEVEQKAVEAAPAAQENAPVRISRQELYEDIGNAARSSHTYVTMVVLSTIVAAIGLEHNSAAIVIGAMVIAPLLGPNVALSLATTLGDLPLARQALWTLAIGVVTVTVLSSVMGVLMNVDATGFEVTSRTQVGIGDIVLALASGCAGALAFTTGVSATLIGVMVAVALLPPVVTFGLLLGGGHPVLALGALTLFLVNLICVNLAGVTTFLVQGMRPTNWWEKDRATKATRIAIGLWAALLAALIAIILLVPED
jgi:uncharacterized hydrophobic protein (TIGR00341 family)